MIRYCIMSMCVLFLLIPYSSANATIHVVPAIITFTHQDLPRSDVEVINTGTEDAYVKIVPNLVVSPGTPNEHKEVIRHAEKAGLLVTPQQLIIPPHERRLVRFMLTTPLGDADRIYRVDIAPVSKKLIPNYILHQKGNTIGIQLLIGYDVLVMAGPAQPKENVKIWRKNKTLFLRNQGNTNALVAMNEQCVGKKCTDIKQSIRLYSGNTAQLPLKFASAATVTVHFLDEQKTLTSN